VIDESEMASNTVTIGCSVTVSMNGKVMPAYKVVGSQEADPMKRAVSEESPFGKALMGKKEGDVVSVDAPAGTMQYKIEKIER
jgi:transcription elongation factor GreA